MADSMDSMNVELEPQQIYYNYAIPLPPPTTAPTVISSDVTVVTTINGGGGGQATGPAITLGSNWNGVNFVASAGSVNLDILNAANARSDLGAAKSGVNSDLTSFTALTGNTGVNPWTGTPDGSSQSTYPATTASAIYTQAEIQGLMDKMQDVTEFMMFLVAALLAPGVVET